VEKNDQISEILAEIQALCGDAIWLLSGVPPEEDTPPAPPSRSPPQRGGGVPRSSFEARGDVRRVRGAK